MVEETLSNWNYLAATLCAALVNALPITCIVTGLAWLLLDRGRKCSAATAYGIWFVVLATAVLLPLAQGLHAPTSVNIRTAAPIMIAPQPEAVSTLALVQTQTAASPMHFPVSIPACLLLLWCVGMLVQFARLAIALRHCLALKRGATPPTEAVSKRFQQLVEAHSLDRPVSIGISDRISVPAVVGYFRPLVVLPEAALSVLDASELDAILLHELAHVRRYDDWAIAIQRLLEALFVFHPLVHLITSKLELQREIACDDFVLTAYKPSAYAFSLTTIAEFAILSPRTSLLGLVVEEPSQLSQRIEKLLDSTRSINTRISWKAFGSLACTLALISLLSLRVPSLMARPVQSSTANINPPTPPTPPEAPALSTTTQDDRELIHQEQELAKQQAKLAEEQAAAAREQVQKAKRQMTEQMQQLGQNLNQQINQELKQQLTQQLKQQSWKDLSRQVSDLQSEILRTTLRTTFDQLARNAATSVRQIAGDAARLQELQSRVNNPQTSRELKEKLDQLRACQKQLETEQQKIAQQLQRALNEVNHDAMERGLNRPAH